MEKKKEINIKKWFSTLKKILTWERITGIVTILSLCVTIYILLPESEVSRLKKNISKNIEVIDTDFQPHVLLHQNDSSLFLMKMVNFQQLVVDYSCVLTTVNSYQDYTEFSYMDFEDARVTIATDLMRIKKAEKLSKECLDALNEILEYEKKLDSKYISYLSLSKKANIEEYKELKEKVSLKYLTKYTELMNKHLEAQKADALNADDYIGYALEEINKLVDNPDFYRYDDAVLNYLIDANKLLKISKRHFMQIEKSNLN